MSRNRFIAVLLALVMVFGTLPFCASAEDTTCQISVEFFGAGSVTVNGEEKLDDFRQTFSVGESVTMTAEASEGFEFLYWVDLNMDRIVSWNATYTFSVATYADYQAVFDEIYDPADALHTVVYLTEGENIIFHQPVPLLDDTYYEDVDDHGMAINGKVWVGWDHTTAQVAQEPGRVIVRPVYNTETYYDIISLVGETETLTRALYESTITIEAPATLNGQKFSYWIAHARNDSEEDQITSFYAKYTFVVTMDTTIEAVYGASYDLGIAARISGDFPSFEESSVTIFAEHSVTTDYTVLQHGMLLTRDLQIGSFESTFVINPSEEKIKKITSNGTQRAGSLRATIRNWYAQDTVGGYYYPEIFARAYVIAKDKNGVTHTVYSPIYCMDYSSVSYSGLFGGDNVDDPFG